MKTQSFLAAIEHPKVVAAIVEAEARSSGEIRVWVSETVRLDPLPAARARFEQLGMTRTQHRNAVLIFLAPRSRTFAVVGDTGIHAKSGDDLWAKVRDVMTRRLGEERPTEALIDAIAAVGASLAAHFPLDPADPPKNELPDDIVTD